MMHLSIAQLMTSPKPPNSSASAGATLYRKIEEYGINR
jgi:hypothetical protein